MVVDFETACEELTLCSEKYCPFIAGKITGNDPCNASYCHIAYEKYVAESAKKGR